MLVYWFWPCCHVVMASCLAVRNDQGQRDGPEGDMLPNPIRLLPRPPQAPPRYLLGRLLNRLFHEAIEEGELDFLDGQVLRLVVSGAGIEIDLTLKDDRLRVTAVGDHWDLRVTGSAYDFMLLASRRVDADTLFFQRRLRTEGNTELGLFVKNFLDSQDLSDLPYSSFIERGLGHAIAMHDRLIPNTRHDS